MPKAKTIATLLSRDWSLPLAAMLGSSVRAKGILLEVRARLPQPVRKALELKGSVLTLALPEDAAPAFRAAERVVSDTLAGAEDLPVIPREIEDILAIKTAERHRWVKDGRLRSAGTRTVKLRGRARKVTFHVFDPRQVEDLLNGDQIDAWREDDAIAAAENRRRATTRAVMARAQKKAAVAKPTSTAGDGPQLRGWAEFERDGPLR